MAILPAWTAETTLTGTDTSHDITLPSSGIDAGQFITIWCSTQESSDAGAPATPSGYTQRWSHGHASSFKPRITCVYKVADGSEEDDVVTFDWGATSVETHIVAIGWTGVDASSPWDTTETGPTNGASDPDPASITTVTDGAVVLGIIAGNRSPSTSTPTLSAGYATGFDQTPDARAFIIETKTVATAGAEDPAALTWTPIDNHTTVTDALRPATGITVTPERAELDLFAASPTITSLIVPERAELSLATYTPAVVSVEPAAALAFADGGHTNPRLEVALNHADVSVPVDYQWTELSGRLRSRLGDLSITNTRGRADEAADTEPSQLATLLDNTDGWLTPGFASSPWWPNVDVGLPLRHWADGSTPALILPGLPGAFAYSPDHADFDVTDVDMRIRLEPDYWSSGVTYIDGAISVVSRRWLVSRWTETDDDRSWVGYIFDGGWPSFRYSADGAAVSQSTGFPTLIAALRPIWLALTVDADDGGGNRVATWWRYDNNDSPPDDVTTWTQIVQTTDSGTMSLHATAAPLAIGAINEGGDAPFAGRILAMELRDAINGTVVANPDFTAQAPGTTSFTDDAGKPWQLAGMAHIARRRLRFCGEVSEIDPFWPYGDNQPLADLDDPRPSESRARITANGVLRRLTRGQDPLRSTLARKVVTEVDNVTAYWPCEDGRQAAHLGAGIPDVDPMVTTGLDMANDDSLPASDALPTVPAGDAATWSAAVPAPTVFDDQWAVEWLFFLETAETSPTSTRLMTVTAAGDAATWQVDIHDVSITLTVLDGASSTLVSSATAHGGDPLGVWILFRLEATQNGADIDWTWSTVNIDTGTGGSTSDTISTATLGRVTGIDTSTTGPPDGLSFGHIIVHDANLATGWLAGHDTAWAGESAAHRFWRLCAEEGIPVEIIGDPEASIHSTLRGDLAASQAMGPQQPKTLVELLRDCVKVDLGVLIEHPGIPGLIYRCRIDIEDQDVRFALDASNNEINGVEPTRDNAELINEIKVTSTSGASAVAVNSASQVRHGRYSDSADINGVGGLDIQDSIITSQTGLATAINEQNDQQAAWRLALGTTDGMRYPTLTVDLGTAPDLIETWLATHLGDRVTLDNLPVQHPADTIELILQHIAETKTPTSWTIDLTFTPGDVWLTGELVE